KGFRGVVLTSLPPFPSLLGAITVHRAPWWPAPLSRGGVWGGAETNFPKALAHQHFGRKSSFPPQAPPAETNRKRIGLEATPQPRDLDRLGLATRPGRLTSLPSRPPCP